MAELNAASQRILNNKNVSPGYTVSVGTVGQYIVDAARQRNIDPNVALAVYQSEGLTHWQSQVGRSSGNQERSYGPYQLYTNGGLGNDFQRDTGFDPTNPNNWKQNVDYSLNYAANKPDGWRPWNGFRETEYYKANRSDPAVFKTGIGQDAKTQPISPGGTAGTDGSIPGANTEGQLTEDQKKLAQDPGSPLDDDGNISKNWHINDQTGELYYNPFKAPPGPQVLDMSKIRQIPSPNPLHDYDSYTYNLSLHILSIPGFNRLVENPGEYKPKPGSILIAGGGRQSDDFLRNPYFIEDFFFDNLKIDTTINTTQNNKNTNAISLSFTILEPNGFTLLDRLIDAVDMFGGKTWIFHPFMLEISFFGYKDGVPDPALRQQTKYLPILFTEIKSRNTTKGAEYSIKASPYNRQALSETHLATPSQFSVKAKTVGDLLGTGEVDAALLAELDATLRNTPSAPDPTSPNANSASQASIDKLSKSTFSANGITNAMNSWYDRIKKNGYTKVKYASVKVEIDDEIKNAKLISVSPNTVQQAAPINPKNPATNTAQQAAGLNKGGISFDGTAMSVPAGTRLDNLINFAIRNSEYIGSQLSKDPDNRSPAASNLQGNQPLKWWKIIPKVKIIDYIPESNTYSLEVTYIVKKWIKTVDYPYAPIGRQPGFVKEYNYMFTGGRSKVSGENQSNRDILDVTIELHTLFIQPITVFKEKDQITSTANGIFDKNQPGYIDTGVSCQPRNESKFLVYDYGKIGPPSKKYIARNLQLQSKNSAQSQSSVTAADLEKSLMSGAAGDLMELKMQIIGDPTLIKQDDVFYGQTLDKDTTTASVDKTPNGSLFTDKGELYVYFNFRSPIDYDQTTGLANPGDNPYTSGIGIYSGIYQIIKVDNTFNRGKFEQSITMNKLLINDNSRSTDFSTVGQRLNTYTNAGFPQVPAALPSRFSGPNIVKAGTAGLAVGVSSVLNAAGAGGSALVSGLLGQVQSLAVGAVKNLVTKELNAVISKGVAELKYIIERPSPEALAKANAEDAARDMEGGPGSETPEAAGGADVTNPPDGAEFNSADASSGVSDSSNYDSLSDAQVGELYGDLSELTDVAADAVEAVAEGAEAVAEGAEVFAEAFDSIGSLFG